MSTEREILKKSHFELTRKKSKKNSVRDPKSGLFGIFRDGITKNLGKSIPVRTLREDFQQPQQQEQPQGQTTKGAQNGVSEKRMNNKMEIAADANSILEEKQLVQQQPMKKPTECSIDLTYICGGNGNDQNALKVDKLEVNLIYGKILIFCTIPDWPNGRGKEHQQRRKINEY
jgi:hypothetical protein